jgi:hypothetical protein
LSDHRSVVQLFATQSPILDARRLARLGSPRSWSPRGADRAALLRPAKLQGTSTPRAAAALHLAHAPVPAASARRSQSSAPLLVRRERDRVSEPPTPGTDSLSVSVLQNSLNPLMPLGAEACGFAAIALIRFAVIQPSKLMTRVRFPSPAPTFSMICVVPRARQGGDQKRRK